MSNQFLYNGYSDYGLRYTYPNNYRAEEQRHQARIENGTWILSTAEMINGVSPTAPKNAAVGSTVEVLADSDSPAYSFSHWVSDVPETEFIPSYTSKHALFLMPDSPIVVTAVSDPIFHVGDRIRINNTAEYWVNGTPIPAGARGLEDSIREIRADGSELLLNVVGAWVHAADVTRVSHADIEEAVPPIGVLPYRNVEVVNGEGSGAFAAGARVRITAVPSSREHFVNWTVLAGGAQLENANSATTYFIMGDYDVTVRANFSDQPAGTQPPAGGEVRVGERVTVNQNVRTWATGEGMPAWVNGRTYPVIEIRTRNGVTQLLLGEGINSWIRLSDITRQGGGSGGSGGSGGGGATTPTPTPPAIRVGDRVRVNQGVRTWATGEGMPSWVNGRTYPVIEIRTVSGVTQLLLGEGINSWIRQTDVNRI